MKFFVCTVEDPRLMDESEYSFEVIEAASAIDAAVNFAEGREARYSSCITTVFVSIFDPKRIKIERHETVTFDAHVVESS